MNPVFEKITVVENAIQSRRIAEGLTKNELTKLHINPETGIMTDYANSLAATTGALVTLLENYYDLSDLEEFVGFAENIATYSEYLDYNFAPIYRQNIGISENDSIVWECLAYFMNSII